MRLAAAVGSLTGGPGIAFALILRLLGAALGGIGAKTGLFPALTLGCGAVGGSSSSNNISPLDLINIRRVAWNTEKKLSRQQPENEALVEMLTRKIMERLG